MNVPTIAYSTFMKYQKMYLHPAVQTTYQQQQSTLLNDIKAEGRELILGGDVTVQAIHPSMALTLLWM